MLPPDLWQFYLKKDENKHLSLEEVKRKYLTEQLVYENYINHQLYIMTTQGSSGGGRPIKSVDPGPPIDLVYSFNPSQNYNIAYSEEGGVLGYSMTDNEGTYYNDTLPGGSLNFADASKGALFLGGHLFRGYFRYTLDSAATNLSNPLGIGPQLVTNLSSSLFKEYEANSGSLQGEQIRIRAVVYSVVNETNGSAYFDKVVFNGNGKGSTTGSIEVDINKTFLPNGLLKVTSSWVDVTEELQGPDVYVNLVFSGPEPSPSNGFRASTQFFYEFEIDKKNYDIL